MFDIRAEELAVLPRDQQLSALRQRMAAISGRVGAVEDAHVPAADVISISGGLGEILPQGGLARGSIVACRHQGLLPGLLAAATSGGHFAAVIGGARLGLLAVAELGGDLDRLAVIDPSSGDPLEIASILADGVPVTVLDVGRLAVPPARGRTVMSKVRSQRGVLIITGAVAGLRPDMDIEARVAGYTGIGHGTGRVREIRLDVRVSGRNLRPRTSQLVLAGEDNHSRWTTPAGEPAAVVRRLTRAG
ncbi:hypothetical protein [Nocardia blacklockiae]|uniref:hypothetical protein n=1 Tax=Nocardia blacklockiae TaxID=480036 RepID=UPI001893B32E|nr:hypothetical protein [Nocardia blacklockiae]MBF6173591.1 hypothetical protein [Nocardia blacklockiae]